MQKMGTILEREKISIKKFRRIKKLHILVNRRLIEVEKANFCEIPWLNRGFLLGDGVFTTLLAQNGQLMFWNDHMARLKHDASIFQLSFNVDGLYEAITNLLSNEGLSFGDARVRVSLSRSREENGLHLTGYEKDIEVVQVSAYTLKKTPAHVMVSNIFRGPGSVLTRTKHFGYQSSLLALQQAKAAKFDDAILINPKGNLVCTTTANLYLKIDNNWRTPSLEEGALPGVIRQRLLKQGHVQEGVLTQADIHKAQAAFMTSSLIGIRPIKRLNEKVFEDDMIDLLF